MGYYSNYEGGSKAAMLLQNRLYSLSRAVLRAVRCIDEAEGNEAKGNETEGNKVKGNEAKANEANQLQLS